MHHAHGIDLRRTLSRCEAQPGCRRRKATSKAYAIAVVISNLRAATSCVARACTRLATVRNLNFPKKVKPSARTSLVLTQRRRAFSSAFDVVGPNPIKRSGFFILQSHSRQRGLRVGAGYAGDGAAAAVKFGCVPTEPGCTVGVLRRHATEHQSMPDLALLKTGRNQVTAIFIPGAAGSAQ